MPTSQCWAWLCAAGAEVPPAGLQAGPVRAAPRLQLSAAELPCPVLAMSGLFLERLCLPALPASCVGTPLCTCWPALSFSVGAVWLSRAGVELVP